MRSLLIATAMCVAALTLTGCSFTVSSPCHSFCHQSCLTSCCGKSDCADTNCCPQAAEETGCGDASCQDESCGECLDCGPRRNLRNWRLQPECPDVDMGEGAPCGLESVSARRPVKGLLGKLGSRDRSACGCDSGDCSCESTMVATEVAPSISDCGCEAETCDGGCGRGRGLFNRKSECASDCDGSACGGACGASRPLAGLFSRGNSCAADCDGTDCGGACGATQTRTALFKRDAACDAGCDGSDCGGACGGTPKRTLKGLFSRGSQADYQTTCDAGCDGSACGGACGGTQKRTLKGLFSRGTQDTTQVAYQTTCDAGCDGTACGGACGGTKKRSWKSIFSLGNDTCGAGCDGSACGGACGAGITGNQGGLFGGRGMGHHAQMRGAAPAQSCGRFGCGRGGKLCLTCKARHGLGLGHHAGHGTCGNGTCGRCKLCKHGMPYAGRVPHTVPTAGMTGQAPQYMYPYYTTRGPRDFLQDACAPGPILPYNPKPTCLPSIGF